MEETGGGMCGTDSGMEIPSLADPGIPFSVFKDIRWGLRSLQPLCHHVPCPEGEAGLGTVTNGVARRLPHERSTTNPGANEEFL